MTLSERIEVLGQLGDHLLGKDEYLEAVMKRTAFHNGWFTEDSQQEAIRELAVQMLNRDRLREWLSRYQLAESSPKKVGIVMAGNIPLVGFHDWLCVFVSGHQAQVKLSEKDPFLFPYLMKILERLDERTLAYTEVTERLHGFEAVIATGSNNSARYFEAYFSKYPNIIRKNRNGVAVLTGDETLEELQALGKDIFRYYGLGCRNVAKLYVPEGYDFDPLLKALHEYREVVLNTKYKNNFDYNYALFVLNKIEFKANGCILLVEAPALQSRIACLHYEFYSSLEEVTKEIQARESEVQCTVAKSGALPIPAFSFGKAQEPALWDYPDGADTLAFLARL
ncbi:acyl-CoA reductase [Phaeodactylibacter sp.]|uniref:acyl-CoA reductase n=1 Tax=Phaeodactylibacter sp. TaxID=1940289 RepID=UPI0025D75D5F|nr:acyl-CoA reductase [Phaeodactylibacter sp.]MCI4651143.1 acyl-CoA reductase [Phaeodactylibacter sp.]MCI5090718.1 acyl-CoA reductase [Phaeodactylibacter sp.]